MKQSANVCNVKASPGSKAFGFVEVLQRPVAPVRFPLEIVNGIHDGPALLIVAGSHACEYAGIEATIRIFKQTHPAGLHGCLICIPVLNTSAFETQTPYVCPIDGLDISGLFPGDANGSASERIAHFLFDEIALRANYVLDLHGGDLPEDLSPYAIFSRSGNVEADNKSEAMARFYGAHCIDEVSRSGMLVHESALRGIPGIICESGGLGRFSEEDVAFHLAGVRNIMAHLEMTDEKPRPPPDGQVTFKQPKIRLGVTRGGILKLRVKVGEKVQTNQLLAEVLDFQGQTIDEIRSPTRAIVRIVIPKYAVNAGDRVVYVSKLPEEEA